MKIVTKTFAVADLHGRFDLMMKAIEAIEASAHSGGKVVWLGDYIDRGPAAASVIDRLKHGPVDAERWEWVCLQGNHEAIMLHCIANPAQLSWWIRNGGGATLISYGHAPTGNVEPKVIPQADIDWVASLPLFYEDQHRVFVHAATDKHEPDLSKTLSDVLQWKLYEDDDEGADHFGKHIVHGHHQFADGPKFFPGRTDLDTGAFYSGRLVIGVFDDEKPGGPVSTIEVKAEPDKRWAA